MKNSEFGIQNEIKRYATPKIEVVEINTSDVITTSPGTETPWYEESDGIWEFSINPQG